MSCQLKASSGSATSTAGLRWWDMSPSRSTLANETVPGPRPAQIRLSKRGRGRSLCWTASRFIQSALC